MSQYLIAHIGHTGKDHEHITWWRPDSRGYTVCIDKAGLYEADEAESICKDGICIAVTKPVAEEHARSTPYFRRSDGSLNKMYDGGPHRVIPNDAQVWLRLLAWRLGVRTCRKPTRPSPIGSKARAIYLPEGGAA